MVLTLSKIQSVYFWDASIGSGHSGMEELSQWVHQAIDVESESLHELSQFIWSHPETCFEERLAHECLTQFLEVRGFQVERGYKGLETAFRATWRLTDSTEPEVRAINVTFICEYDALPEIGHACGHNLIAQLAVAAGLGLKAALEKLGRPVGVVTVLGTPAEEGGGGKIDLINAGALDDVDIAMMCHPSPANAVFANTLATTFCKVTYQGKATHASAFPWEGVNALDAVVLAYNNISAFRQQLKPTSRMHGIISKGGVKPNIIPDLTEMEYMVRADNVEELRRVVQKVDSCFVSAATATGCTVDVAWSPKVYADMVTNTAVADIYRKHMEAVEPERVGKPDDACPLGATDMGNVSQVVPSMQPMYRIGDQLNHSKDFTVVAGSRQAETLTNNQAKALALTGLEVLLTPGLLQTIQAEFKVRQQGNIDI